MSLVLLSLIAPSNAATWIVDDDGGHDFTELQAAIDAAEPGDTLLVRDGSYTAGGIEWLDHHNGSGEHGWCGVLFLDKDLHIVGESTAGVVVHPDLTGDCERSAAILGRYGESSVSNLTIVHDAPGWETWGAAYSAFTTLALNEVEDHPIFLTVDQVVIRMDDSQHESAFMYMNGAQSGMFVRNTTVDVVGPTMMSAWVNNWGLGYVFDSIIVDNMDDDFTLGGGVGSGGVEGDYALLHGMGFSSETMLDADPMFVDPDGLDYTLQAGSPAIDAGNPEASRNDRDGSRNDLGAHGGPAQDFPLPEEPEDSGLDDTGEPVDEGDDEDGGEGEGGGCSTTPIAPLSAMAALLGGLALIRRRV